MSHYGVWKAGNIYHLEIYILHRTQDILKAFFSIQVLYAVLENYHLCVHQYFHLKTKTFTSTAENKTFIISH